MHVYLAIAAIGPYLSGYIYIYIYTHTHTCILGLADTCMVSYYICMLGGGIRSWLGIAKILVGCVREDPQSPVIRLLLLR